MRREVEYNMPQWPNFLRQKMKPRPRQEGFNPEGPCIDVGELTADEIDELCADFRNHCASRAAKIMGIRD